MLHKHWASALEPGSHNQWSPHTPEPMLHKKRRHYKEKPVQHNQSSPCSLQPEKACTKLQWPSTALNKIKTKQKKKTIYINYPKVSEETAEFHVVEVTWSMWEHFHLKSSLFPSIHFDLSFTHHWQQYGPCSGLNLKASSAFVTFSLTHIWSSLVLLEGP